MEKSEENTLPREKDPDKYMYARTLLSQNLPIAKVREELKRIFGSAIAPNSLLEMKDEIEKEKKKRKDNPIPQIFRTILGGKSDAQKEVETFNMLLNKIDSKLDNHSILITKIFSSLDQSADRSSIVARRLENLNQFYTDGDFKNLGKITIEANIKEHILEVQKKILLLLEKGEKTKKSLQKALQIDGFLLEHILHSMLETKAIMRADIGKTGQNFAIYIKPIDDEEYHIDMISEGEGNISLLFFHFSQQILDYLTDEPQPIDMIIDKLDISPDVVRILTYDMFLNKRIRVLNSLNIPRLLVSRDEDSPILDDGPSLDEIEAKILQFLTNEYGEINQITEKFQTDPTKVIMALNRIGEKWPENCYKYQNY